MNKKRRESKGLFLFFEPAILKPSMQCEAPFDEEPGRVIKSQL
jgi:hypothetical protein